MDAISQQGVNEMNDGADFASGGNGNCRFRVGCAVQVVGGALDGMTGVLMRHRPGNNCVIRLDGIPPGVLVLIDAALLRERSLVPAAHAVRPVPVAARRLRHFNFDVTGS
jgi:hypothetical protein